MDNMTPMDNMTSQTAKAPVKSNTTILSQRPGSDMEEVVIVASRNRVAPVTE
jgi:hypothetical protein